ncbi:TetR family transcriptional regulator [Dactylosporangium fulvum]|uniref:TetR/AcrR family transcriptional regulator n=1 Tax=Dactylosporangium fulvum TaxID=53359 RepID=A0ABY5WCP6_9ACTN|nr:TetR/AcrR family transcriptional regulator [Dactylosporangium fulvum]UWP87066.1 TetR/AcrR family transcriptional regulator [Dactylosporangium fulvum]
MTGIPVRDRLVDAAFDLFDERGYEQTTVDDIADRAGVGRTTLFRHYRSKEDVIFPDHDRLLAAVKDRLATSTADTAIVAVTEAVRLVLQHYVEEGGRSRRRYKLTSRVATLRDREIASVARYQRLFREFIAEWMEPSPGAALRAELMAAAVVSAHNHVLRRWLRRDTTDPVAELDAAMAQVVSLFTRPGHAAADGGGTTVIVLQDQRDPEYVAATIRQALHNSPA